MAVKETKVVSHAIGLFMFTEERKTVILSQNAMNILLQAQQQDIVKKKKPSVFNAVVKIKNKKK